jgi:hypothetical protein
LFFGCCFARISWRSSFWPFDSIAWSFLSFPDSIKGISLPHSSLGIPKTDTHLFQIYAAVLCYLLWFSRNKALHEGIIPNSTTLASSINKTTLAHSASWSSLFSKVDEALSPPAKGSSKINFNTAICDNFFAQAIICRNSKVTIIKSMVSIDIFLSFVVIKG